MQEHPSPSKSNTSYSPAIGWFSATFVLFFLALLFWGIASSQHGEEGLGTAFTFLGLAVLVGVGAVISLIISIIVAVVSSKSK